MSPRYDVDERHDPGHGLEQSVWTDADFARLSWHDCSVVALAWVPDDEDEFAGRLLLDLDYIVRWAGGRGPGESFTFWVAPATLIFHGAYDLKGDLETGNGVLGGFELDAITREAVADRLGYDRWSIEGSLGISLRAAGFRQIIRQEPLHVTRQRLSTGERGGVSFGEAPYDGASSELSSTHAANPPRRQRLDTAEVAATAEPPAQATFEELERLDWELSHTRFWKLILELRRSELGGDAPTSADAHEDDHLRSPIYQGLATEHDELVRDRDQALGSVRAGAARDALRHVGEELEYLAQQERELFDLRQRVAALLPERDY